MTRLVIMVKSKIFKGYSIILNRQCYRSLCVDVMMLASLFCYLFIYLFIENGFLNPLFGRYRNGLPNPDDHIHLGTSGLKNFVLNIKSIILYRKSSSIVRTQPTPPARGHCKKICHAKCAKKLYRFNHIEDSWCCWECSSLEESRYNPFRSCKYDEYSQSDNNVFEEIHQLERLLNDCKRYYYLELKSLIAKSTDPLSILFKNIDGVASNFDSFSSELLINNSNISTVTLAETNLDECNKNLYNLPSFQCEYQSKILGKSKGSGLAIYVKENFLYTRKEEFCQTTPNLESLFISINNTEVTTYVGVVYRPPNGDPKTFISELNSLLQKLPSSNVYLTGDINTDLLKSSISDFEDIMYGNGFVPLISIATHFKPGCKPSCIDNILTNSTDNIITSGVCSTAADHHVPVFCLINSNWKESEDEPAPQRYDYNASNMYKFENLFSTYLNESHNFDNIETNENNFEELLGKLNELVDKCFLMDISMLNSRCNRINNPWITNGIIASISHRDYL